MLLFSFILPLQGLHDDLYGPIAHTLTLDNLSIQHVVLSRNKGLPNCLL